MQFEIVEAARKILLAWLERRGGPLNDYVFPGRNNCLVHMSTRQYARLLREWVIGIGLQAEEYGAQSLRRTKTSVIYKAIGNLRAVEVEAGLIDVRPRRGSRIEIDRQSYDLLALS